MANEEHLALLKQGIAAWNDWREYHFTVKLDLSGANLSKANLGGADLSKADLREAYLYGADLSEADFSEAHFYGSDLSKANLGGANLSKANLGGANLSGADFSKANLGGANLSGADVTGACLKQASLRRAQALAANFTAAIFTGACLEDWNINSATKLDGVICDYVYLQYRQQERRPSSGDFKPGEFTKLFQKALETVDLIFRNGIDWQAFLTSFQKLQVECGGEELSIQAIENKNDGAFVIRVNVPPDADKAEIEKYLKREYEVALKALDNKYRYQLKTKDEQLVDYRQRNTDLTDIVKLLAARPINNSIEVTAKAESESMSDKYNLSNAKFGGGFAGDGGTQIGGTLNDYSSNIDYSSKQSLAEVAAEIQQLLTQLQTQGYKPEEAQQQVATDLVQQAQTNPTVMGKLVGWGKSLGDAAAKTTVSEAAKEVFKLALRLSGLLLP